MGRVKAWWMEQIEEIYTHYDENGDAILALYRLRKLNVPDADILAFVEHIFIDN